MGCGGNTISRLCLALICSSFWLGFDLHLWLVANTDHNSHTCSVCQQAHTSSKATLTTASGPPIGSELIERIWVLPADMPVVTRHDDPISLRGPPSDLRHWNS